MRRAAAALLMIPLCGCVADQKKTFAACQYPLARQFGKEQTLLAGEVETCMKVNGFKLQISKGCPDDTISEINLSSLRSRFTSVSRLRPSRRIVMRSLSAKTSGIRCEM